MKSVWLANIIKHELNNTSTQMFNLINSLENACHGNISFALYERNGEPGWTVIPTKDSSSQIYKYEITDKRLDSVNYSSGKLSLIQNAIKLHDDELFFPLSYEGTFPFGFCQINNAKELFEKLKNARGVNNSLHKLSIENFLPKEFIHNLYDVSDLIYKEAMGEILHRDKQPLYKCEQVSKSFGSGSGKVEALKNINTTIYKNELTIINGSSGSGKTTFLNLLAGIIKPDKGKLYFENNRIDNMSRKQQLQYRREKIGFIYQNYNLIQGLTVLENIRVASYIVDNSLKETDVLSLVNLRDKINSLPNQLSGGQQQRVCIARALVKNPGVLLCDEPTGALDTENSSIVLKIIKDLINTQNVSVIMITHNPEISYLGDRCITMSNGQIINDYIQPFALESSDIKLQ